MADLTLLEKLRQIEACKKPGDPMPPFLVESTNDWLDPISQVAKEAADALEHKDRLQGLYDQLMEDIDKMRADSLERRGPLLDAHRLAEHFHPRVGKNLTAHEDWRLAVADAQKAIDLLLPAASSEHARSKP